MPPNPYPLKDLCKVYLVLLAVEALTSCPLSPFDYANTIITGPRMRYRPRHHPHITMERPVIPPLIVFRWTLAVEDSMLGTVRHALKVSVIPHTRSDDLMVLVRHIIFLLATIPTRTVSFPVLSTVSMRSSMQPQCLNQAIILNSLLLLSLRKLSAIA